MNRIPPDTLKILIIILPLGILAGYFMPWIVGPGAGLSFNAYDLAEWTTLHPTASHDITPLPAFLLRLPLLCVVIMISFAWNEYDSPTIYRRLSCALVFLIILFSLPPLDFFSRENIQNANYQQQIGLTIAMLLSGIIGFSGILHAARYWTIIGICVIGIVTSILGMTGAAVLFDDFAVSIEGGLGFIFALLSFLLGLTLSGLIMAKLAQIERHTGNQKR